MKKQFAGICVAAAALLAGTASWAAPPAFEAPAPAEQTLENGLRVVVFEDNRLPIARVQLLVPGGIAAQYPHEAGLAHFTAQMVGRGTTTRDAARFEREVADLGVRLTGTARRDFTLFDIGVLTGDLSTVLGLLSDAVRNPTFSADEVGRVRFEVSRAVIELHLNIVSMAEEQIWPFAMASHAYAHTPAGDVPSIVKIDREMLIGFHDRYYKPGGSVLVVAGDVTLDTVLEAAQAAFGPWSGKAELVPVVPLARSQLQGGVRVVDVPSRRRTEIRVSFPAPERGSSDYMAFTALNRVLGGGPESRLRATHIPGVLGAVRSTYTSLRDGGLLIISAPAYSDSVDAAVAALRAVVEEVRNRPPDGPETSEAIRVMRNTYPLKMESLGGLVTEWATADHYGLGEEALSGFAAAMEDVTPGDLVRLAAEWLDWGRASVLAIGPANDVKAQLASLGEVEVVKVQDAPQAEWATTVPGEEDFARGRAVADLVIDAHGGAEALGSIEESSIDATITVDLQGKETQGRLRQARKDPLQFREVMEVFVYGSEFVLNGELGWVHETASGAVEVADSLQRASMRSNFESDVVHLIRLLTDETLEVAHRGQEMIAGRAADVLHVRVGNRRRWLLFDAETHLLVGLDVRGGVPPQVLARRVFSDHREVGGVMWPFREERFEYGQRTMRIDAQQIAVNPGFADDLFTPPQGSR